VVRLEERKGTRIHNLFMTTQKTILIIDDEKELREVLEEKLKREGFKTHTARDGQEGLMVALKEKPDLILLDVVMPKIDGISMLQELRKDEWGKTVQVIFLTVVEDPRTLARAVELGGYEYFVKTDWDIDEIVKKVKEKVGE